MFYKSIPYFHSGQGLADLFREEPKLFFLNSSFHDKSMGRYSFMGFDPFDSFQLKGKDSIHKLRDKWSQFSEKSDCDQTPLSAGIVGFIGYEYGARQENIHLRSKDCLNVPDGLFCFYDCVITIDHFASKLIITSTGWPEKTPRLRKIRAKERLAYIENKLRYKLDKPIQPRATKLGHTETGNTGVALESNLSKQDYVDIVKKALQYIVQGDIYQVNLSQRFQLDVSSKEFNSLDIFKALTDLSPAPFGAYFDAEEFQIISNSPERFLHFKKGVVQTRPMKGTRSRGENRKEDQRFKDDLNKDRKEIAELLMITDLLRNDLGRVCEYGTVRTKALRTIETYETVFQATSTVEGLVKEGYDAFDILRACFPGGSITGCPKIRSMQVIEELEKDRRGVYTGALGYVGFNGEMDFSVLIRTLFVQKEIITFHVGSGIVSDSVPEKEYEETQIKAKAMRACLNQMFADNPILEEVVC